MVYLLELNHLTCVPQTQMAYLLELVILHVCPGKSGLSSRTYCVLQTQVVYLPELTILPLYIINKVFTFSNISSYLCVPGRNLLELTILPVCSRHMWFTLLKLTILPVCPRHKWFTFLNLTILPVCTRHKWFNFMNLSSYICASGRRCLPSRTCCVLQAQVVYLLELTILPVYVMNKRFTFSNI